MTTNLSDHQPKETDTARERVTDASRFPKLKFSLFILGGVLLYLFILTPSPVLAASTTYSYPNSNIILSGAAITSSNFGGYAAVCPSSGTSGEFDFQVTGTQLTTFVYAFSNITYVVDGVTTTPSITTGAWTPVTIFSGLTDAPHNVSIMGGGDACFGDVSFITVTGSAPSLQLAPGFATTNWVLSSNTSYFVNDGSMDLNGAGYYQGNFQSSLRFQASATTVKIWTYGNGQVYHLYIDGVDPGPTH